MADTVTLSKGDFKMTIYTNFDDEVINYKLLVLKRTAQHYKQIAKILASDEVQEVFKKSGRYI